MSEIEKTIADIRKKRAEIERAQHREYVKAKYRFILFKAIIVVGGLMAIITLALIFGG